MSTVLKKTAQALCARGFEAHVLASAKEAAAFVLDLVPEGASVGIGGSMTVKDMHLGEALAAGGREVLWHWDAPPADRPAVLARAMRADCYLASANALTEGGLIVQIDGTGNRVAALTYGPKLVCLIVGRNKIVSGGYAQAVARIRQVACPQNARRLGLDTPCAIEGRCNAAACTGSMCAVTAAYERAPGGRRFVVLLVDEEMGY